MLVPRSFDDLCAVFLLFIVYSVLGWCGEMLYCSIPKGHICEKRGFLNGFLCPIYGHGALLVLYALNGGMKNPLLTFLCGAVLTSALEYFTSWLMETLFHMRWWDYSNYKFQINGRVCLLNSTCFGLACVLLCHVVHPWLWGKLLSLGSGVIVPLASFLCGIYLTDTVLSVRSAIQLGNRLEKLQELKEQLKAQLAERAEEWAEGRAEERAARAGERAIRAEERAAYADELRERIRALRDGQDIFERRLLHSHPQLRTRHPDLLEAIRRHRWD